MTHEGTGLYTEEKLLGLEARFSKKETKKEEDTDNSGEAEQSQKISESKVLYF